MSLNFLALAAMRHVTARACRPSIAAACLALPLACLASPPGLRGGDQEAGAAILNSWSARQLMGELAAAPAHARGPVPEPPARVPASGEVAADLGKLDLAISHERSSAMHAAMHSLGDAAPLSQRSNAAHEISAAPSTVGEAILAHWSVSQARARMRGELTKWSERVETQEEHVAVLPSLASRHSVADDMRGLEDAEKRRQDEAVRGAMRHFSSETASSTASMEEGVVTPRASSSADGEAMLAYWSSQRAKAAVRAELLASPAVDDLREATGHAAPAPVVDNAPLHSVEDDIHALVGTDAKELRARSLHAAMRRIVASSPPASYAVLLGGQSCRGVVRLRRNERLRRS